jgi:hypothetical protein
MNAVLRAELDPAPFGGSVIEAARSGNRQCVGKIAILAPLESAWLGSRQEQLPSAPIAIGMPSGLVPDPPPGPAPGSEQADWWISRGAEKPPLLVQPQFRPALRFGNGQDGWLSLSTPQGLKGAKIAAEWPGITAGSAQPVVAVLPPGTARVRLLELVTPVS